MTLNGGAFASGTPVVTEGIYELAVSASDLAGNTASQLLSFVVDVTPPAISITGVADGQLVNTDLIAQIAIADVNLNASTTLLNGAPYVSGTPISSEGVYQLAVDANDLASNTSAREVQFEIDKTPPVIEITGVTGGEYRSGIVTPVIAATDINLETVTITLDGAPFVSGTPITADGVHTITVEAIDGAGNSTTASRTFTIDTLPPAIVINGVADGDNVNVDVIPGISITYINLASSSITLNGQPFVSGTPVSTEGNYELVVSADDLAGNQSSTTLNFIIDKTPPAIDIAGVTDGLLTNAIVTPVISVIDIHLATQSVTLNGSPFVSATPVTAEGEYQILVTAGDIAGNTSSAQLSFEIDTTPPAIDVSGIAEGDFYAGGVVPTVNVTDKNLTGSTVTLNGAPFVSGTEVSAEGEYVLAVEASDGAGNSSATEVNFVIDLTPPEIALTGIDEGVSSPAAVTIDAAFTDTWLATTELLLNGAPYVSGTAITDEGDYLVTAAATDLAGNETTASVGFNIDLTPPLVEITGVEDGAYYNTCRTPVVSVTDERLNTVDIQLDGAPYETPAEVCADGEHILTVVADDLAGNAVDVLLTFTIDTVAATITVTGVEDGGIYNSARIIDIDVVDDALDTVTITLDGAPFNSGGEVASEGNHVLEVEAVDLAGNTASTTITFTIDLTPPLTPIVTSPADFSVVEVSSVDITGTAEPESVVEISNAGVTSSAITGIDGNFFVPGVPLVEGLNVITLTAIDRRCCNTQYYL